VTTTRYEVVLRNMATGGRVRRVSRVEHFDEHTARAEARRRNEREGRQHRNVCWTVRTR
jgi:hypothetical protein